MINRVRPLLMRALVIVVCLGICILGNDAAAHATTAQELNDITELWTNSAHALNDVNCTTCHQSKGKSQGESQGESQGQNQGQTKEFIAAPDHESCRSCHEQAVDTFLLSKHGIRLFEEKSALTPAMARLPMQHDAMQKQMNCNACHDVHSVNTIEASVDACLTCHSDNHSLNYQNSKHAGLFAESKELPRPGPSAVSCATCHLPRLAPGEGNDPAAHLRDSPIVHVNHNNTYTLKPQDRMVGDVCMNCHGLEYSYNSIFDPELVEANFDRPPTLKMESFELMKASEERRAGNASE